MLDNFLINFEETCSDRFDIVQTNVKNTIDRTWEQRGSFQKIGSTRKLTTRKCWEKFQGHLTRKVDLQNLIHTGHGKKAETACNVTCLCERMAQQGQRKRVWSKKLLRAIKDRRLWKTIITHVL